MSNVFYLDLFQLCSLHRKHAMTCRLAHPTRHELHLSTGQQSYQGTQTACTCTLHSFCYAAEDACSCAVPTILPPLSATTGKLSQRHSSDYTVQSYALLSTCPARVCVVRGNQIDMMH
jgi:hypothetical protein